MKSREGMSKRRKVTFAVQDQDTDAGIQAKDCIVLHLVCWPEELQSKNSSEVQGMSFKPEFTEQVLGEDVTIYGYKELKIAVWLNAFSFHAYVDIHYTEKVERLKFRKKPTDLTALMKRIFGAALIEDREIFMKNFSSYQNDIKSLIKNEGKVVKTEKSKSQNVLSHEDSDTLNFVDSSEEIVRFELSDARVQEWEARLVPLVLLCIEGGLPLEQDDPNWEIYTKIKWESRQGALHCRLLGFCNVYRFYHYPDSCRLRISQILVFPPYQGCKHGLQLLEAVNHVAVERDCYDVTVEEPSKPLQELRDSMDCIRLISFAPALSELRLTVQRLKETKLSDSNGPRDSKTGETFSGNAVKVVPSKSLSEEIRKHLKINKKQLKRCWKILIFLCLDPRVSDGHENFHIYLMEEIMSQYFDKATENCAAGKHIIDISKDVDASKSFIMFRSGMHNGDDPETLALQPLQPSGDASQEQLKGLFEDSLKEITQAAEKVSHLCKTLKIPLPLS